VNAPLHADDGLQPLADFARLYRETVGLVRAVLARLGVPPAALDDATQDVYVVLYRHRARFDHARAVEPWLVGIARRVAFRYRRSHARKQQAHEALAWASAAAAPESTAGRVEARQFLERFIAELSPERRQVFVLGELYGMTGPEIARRLDIPVDTAYTRLRAARLQLERALVAAAADEPAPSREVAHHGWLVLLPRLVDGPAPASGGWLAAALAKLQSSFGALVVAGVAGVAAVIVARPSPGDAPASVAAPHRPDRAAKLRCRW
jgi:RNA polymerase sigma-70 factor (ECF subfamily)